MILRRIIEMFMKTANMRMTAVALKNEQGVHFALKGLITRVLFGNFFERDFLTSPTMSGFVDRSKTTNSQRRFPLNMVNVF